MPRVLALDVATSGDDVTSASLVAVAAAFVDAESGAPIDYFVALFDSEYAPLKDSVFPESEAHGMHRLVIWLRVHTQDDANVRVVAARRSPLVEFLTVALVRHVSRDHLPRLFSKLVCVKLDDDNGDPLSRARRLAQAVYSRKHI